MPTQRRKPWTGSELLDWLRDQVESRDRSTCWEWPAKSLVQGYPRVTYLGKQQVATGVALILDGQPKPPAPGNNALHSCDNPPCCNPAHLRWGTKKDNKQDQREHGRFLVGEDVPGAKLTAAQAAAIRVDVRPVAEIGAEYGIHPRYVYRIRNGQQWRHLSSIGAPDGS